MSIGDDLRQLTQKKGPDLIPKRVELIEYEIEKYCRSVAEHKKERSAECYLYEKCIDGIDTCMFEKPSTIRDFLRNNRKFYNRNFRGTDNKYWLEDSCFMLKQSSADRIVKAVNMHFQGQGFTTFIFEYRTISIFPHDYYMYYFKASW